MIDVTHQPMAAYLPNAMLLFNAQAEMLWCNHKANQLFSLSEKTRPTYTFADLIPSSIITFEHLKEKTEGVEIFLSRKPDLRLTLQLYQDGDHYALIALDVTHVYHLEKMRQDFVANVSHEMRTPLTVIHGFIETLVDTVDPNDRALKAVYAQMFQQTIRMEHLVNDLLLLSRLETDLPNQEDKIRVDVPKMLKAIAKDAMAISPDQSHHVHLALDEGLKLPGIERELHSAFSNLIINAIKYTPAGGDIYIEWYQQGQKAILSVKDTGLGIEEQHIPRLTERFYRVDKARSRTHGGTGLGLAIVKHVLLRHHAQLVINSKLGEGSTFTCQFNLGETHG